MKHLKIIIPILFLAFILQNCVEEEDALPQQIQFSVDLKLTDASGARISALPDGTMLRVSIQTGSGDPVLTDHTMELLSFGGSYMTEPIELNPGRYKIVDFFLVHGSQVLYATPHKGSPLAGAVVHPLEHGFNVGKNKVSNIEMEVVNVNQKSPEDFGYVSFNIGIVNTFQLSVFTKEEGKFSLTSAKAHILNGTDTIRSFDLKNKVNLISFQGDVDDTYSLVVIKNGYARFTREFDIGDLYDELDNKPLKVYLEPALTMLAYSSRIRPENFSIRLSGSPGSEINVDWGDGSTDSYIMLDLHIDGSTELAHTYPAVRNYFVSVTGAAVQNITHFYSYYGGGQMDNINLEHLPELVDLRIGLTRGPKVVDLTHNPKLEYVDCREVRGLEKIYLPISHNIRSIDIRGPIGGSQITTSTIDNIINNIWANALMKNLKIGVMALERSEGSNSGEMIGPPSEASLVKLRELRDSYGWVIDPNP